MKEISRNTQSSGEDPQTSGDANNDQLTGFARIENTDYVTGKTSETFERVYGLDYVEVSNDPDEQRQINAEHASLSTLDEEGHLELIYAREIERQQQEGDISWQ